MYLNPRFAICSTLELLDKLNLDLIKYLIVKLKRSVDASNILTKQSSYPDNIVIKPDLSPEEREIQKILLSARWDLIQSGAERKSIKIKGSSIYVAGRCYGKVSNLQFCKSLENIPDTPAVESSVVNNDSPASEPSI